MTNIIYSIKKRPINIWLIIIVVCLYGLNNHYLKSITTGDIQYFMICYFNDLICPILLLSYTNILLISIDQEMKRAQTILLFGFCAGIAWELISPLIKSSTTTDLMDIFIYTGGSLFYWCMYTLAEKIINKECDK